MQLNPYTVPLIISTIPTCYLLYTAWKHRSEFVARLFMLVVLAILWLTITYILDLLSTQLSWKLFWLNTQYISFTSIPALWAAFILAYTGKSSWISRRRVLAVSGILFILLLLVWTDQYHHLAWTSLQLVEYQSYIFLETNYGLINYILIGVNYILAVVAVLVAFNYRRQSSGIFQAQASLILLSTAAPFVVGIDDAIRPTSPVDWLVLAYVLACIPAGYALFRYRLLDIIPAARDQVFRSIGDAVIVLDIKNRIVDVNPAAEQLIRLPASVMISNRLSRLIPHAIDLIRRYENAQAIQDEIAFKVGNQMRYFDLRISPLRESSGHLSGRVILVQDITSRKNAEEMLKQSEERFSKLFQVNPAGILLVSIERDRCTDINESARHILEYNFAEINAIPFSKSSIWINPEDWPQLISQVKETGLLRNMELKLRSKTGSIRDVLISADYVLIDNHQQLIIQMNDITDRKRAERKTVELELEREKVRILRSFISDTSHDLRTPITSLLNSSYLLTKYSDKLTRALNKSQLSSQKNQPKQTTTRTLALMTKHAGITNDTAQRLHHLVESMYEMARLDAQNRLNPVTTDLNTFVNKTLNSIRPLADQKSILITFKPARSLPQVLIDPPEFSRALENLLHNGIQYTPSNGAIHVKTSHENEYVILEVADTGIGIAKEDLPYIFERFYRTDSSRSTQTGGMGLGLPIVRKIIEAHEGAIEVTSEIDVGTTFVIRLPNLNRD